MLSSILGQHWLPAMLVYVALSLVVWGVRERNL
jgi:hypothetical protein